MIQDTVKINGKKYKVTLIASGSCSNMKKLTKLTIGKNVKTIGKEAFKSCKKGKEILFKGTAVKSIEISAFLGWAKKITVQCKKSVLKKYRRMLEDSGVSSKITMVGK